MYSLKDKLVRLRLYVSDFVLVRVRACVRVLVRVSMNHFAFVVPHIHNQRNPPPLSRSAVSLLNLVQDDVPGISVLRIMVRAHARHDR